MTLYNIIPHVWKYGCWINSQRWISGSKGIYACIMMMGVAKLYCSWDGINSPFINWVRERANERSRAHSKHRSAPHGWNQCQSNFCLWFLPAQLTFTLSSDNETPHLYFRDLLLSQWKGHLQSQYPHQPQE